MSHSRLWWRWSWRDLRARWLQVVAIAMIIALGTGIFAGLGGQKSWRITSYDRSYGRLNVYDLHMALSEGSYLDGAALRASLAELAGIETLETRLMVTTLVDASHDDETIMVRGGIVGVEVADGGPHINRVYVDADSGRTLTAADATRDLATERGAVVLEYKFAQHYGLNPGTPLRISGDVLLDVVGLGHSPEYFMIIPETGTFFGEGDYAALFMPLVTAQQLVGREGLVNDVVFSLEEDADPAIVQAELERYMTAQYPSTGIDIMTLDEDPIRTMLYNDAEGDQWMWNFMALLFLLGAALGAFSLSGRMVEAQRRQIGINMALGVPRRWIAFRPVLAGVQIALLGTLFGLVAGLLINYLFTTALKEMAPIPYYGDALYMPGYIRAALLGIAIPVIATLIPVWRAVRVAPVEAITSGYLVAKGGGLSWVLNYLPLPGRSFSQMPVKNLLRSPWRTLLTVLGIVIAIALMTFIVGAMDSYEATMQMADRAYRYQGDDRVLITLDFFYPVNNDVVTALSDLRSDDDTALFTATENALMLGGSIAQGATEIDVLLELHPMDQNPAGQNRAIWVPALTAGSLTADEPGLIISEKAADDLGVAVGDRITLKHPRREGLFDVRLVEIEVPVIGLHNNPLRPLSYMNLNAAEMMGLAGLTNLVIAEPTAGVNADEIKLALINQPGVASAKSIQEFSESVADMLAMITTIMAVVQGVAIILAFLIAFNSTSISVDERVREIATMFAFGLPLRTVTRMQVLENVIIGSLGTVIGIIAGWGLLNVFVLARAKEEMPDLNFIATITPQTIVLAAGLGVLAVALTPLLSIRRMRNMNIPDTLRVME